MPRLGLVLLLSAGLGTASLTLASPAARGQANDMFPTKAAAEQRARTLSCSGVFAMGREWMPCSSFDAYQKAVQKADSKSR
ncbi:DUF3721 domain-containing protein [Synechococcus sp. BA-124 BA4]|jgi:hypothetical protein|uniref:DUF3721 domain-containing protein n=1 Tax=unclassified Synechococcus TaxID=2626047 RepID=UPI0018CE3C4E|nr:MULTISPECIES: DUF3721 domain-containing protein [unclassified Synechococcus]MEA5398724.1 DUF3721 domain-containing protein [Synechococcus sp. BA-124 BA4]QPN56742.1 DUF3721 domain-containing protein [Synechococcus sp. CBW1107]CAK6696164.1 hypothetical protein BBFGKLBO_01995 [Synechococcus sp. CBW1107]